MWCRVRLKLVSLLSKPSLPRLRSIKPNSPAAWTTLLRRRVTLRPSCSRRRRLLPSRRSSSHSLAFSLLPCSQHYDFHGLNIVSALKDPCSTNTTNKLSTSGVLNHSLPKQCFFLVRMIRVVSMVYDAIKVALVSQVKAHPNSSFSCKLGLCMPVPSCKKIAYWDTKKGVLPDVLVAAQSQAFIAKRCVCARRQSSRRRWLPRQLPSVH